MPKRPYSVKPRFLDQPLWWWLGNHNDDLWEIFGHRAPEKISVVKRLSLIWRRGCGVAPHPIVSIKEIYERGRRGYTTSDTWSLDSYLCSWMPEAIAKLRDGSYGHPATLCTHDDPDCSEGYDAAHRWDEILTKIERGFTAAREINDLDYYDPKATWDENRAREEALVAEFNESMDLFKEWFFALWN